MKILFKDHGSKTQCDIYLESTFLGTVKMDVWTQKWSIAPSFRMPYSYSDVSRNKYASSYEAGKAIVELYNFLFLGSNEEEEKGIGINLEDILVFLKTRT